MGEEVLQALARLEETGGRAVLATIVKTVGSTPRKEGTQMLVFRDGGLLGTIGGGCGEAEVRQAALGVLDSGRPAVYHLNLTADLAAEEGMVCGGRMDVFLDPVP